MEFEARPLPSTSFIAARRALPFRIFLVLAGIALAAAGQLILRSADSGDPDLGRLQLIGGALLIMGAVGFGVGTAFSLPVDRDFGVDPVETRASDGGPRPRPAWILVPVFLSVAGAVSFAVAGESPFVVWLWLGGIIGLLAATLSGNMPRPAAPRIRNWWHLILLTAVLLTYLVSRTVWLSILPLNLDGDFASVGLQARALLNAKQTSIFGFGWAAMPVLGYLPSWISLRIFGDSLAGLNASGVVQGLMVVIGVYLLGRDLFHPRFGLVASALLVASLAFLAVSRQSVYIDPLGFMVFAVYFLLLGYRRRLGWAMVLGGILGGLALLMYYSGRLLLPVVGALILYLWLQSPQVFKGRLGLLGLWILAAVVTLGPMLLVFGGHTEAMLSRTREVFITHPAVVTHLKGVYKVDTLWGVLLENARRSALLFHYYRDTSTQFALGRPLLDGITGTLFALGVGAALAHIRKTGAFLILAWTALGVFVGAFLTNNSPFWPRLVVLIPTSIMLAALALDLLYDLLVGLLSRLGRGAASLATFLLLLLLAGIGASNWSAYVKSEGSWADGRTRIARYLAAQPPSIPAYLVSSRYTARDREFEFLVPGRFVDGLDPEQIQQFALAAPKPALLILTPEQSPSLEILQRTYPGGRIDVGQGNSPGEIAFYAVHAP